MLGIRSFFAVGANQVFTSNVTLATVGLLAPIAANQKIKFRAQIPFSVGATGGIRAQVLVPAGGAAFIASIKLVNTVSPSITTAEQVASAAFTNAAANAGNHWLEIDGYVENGSTAGSVDIQIAQNTSDALSLTVLEGGSMDVVTF